MFIITVKLVYSYHFSIVAFIERWSLYTDEHTWFHRLYHDCVFVFMQQILGKVNIEQGNNIVEVGSGSGGAMKYITEVLSVTLSNYYC